MSIDKIRNIGLDKLITQVYDFDSLTTDELLCKFAQKINIIIEHFNYLDDRCYNSDKALELKLQYLLNEGLDEQVAKEILKKINDGTLGKLINANLLTIEKNQKAYISFIFDDNPLSNRPLFDIFKEFGFTFTTGGIIKRNLNNEKNAVPLSINLQELKNGFDYQSHSMEHQVIGNWGDGSFAKAEYEIEESAEQLKRWGIAPNFFIAPYNAVEEKFMHLVRRNYDFAFTAQSPTRNYNVDTFKFMDKNIDKYKMYRFNFDEKTNSLEDVKKIIDRCIKEKAYLPMFAHQLVTNLGTSGTEFTESYLRNVLSYIKSKVDEGELIVDSVNRCVNAYFGIPITKMEKSFNYGNNILPTTSLLEIIAVSGTAPTRNVINENEVKFTIQPSTSTQKILLTKTITLSDFTYDKYKKLYESSFIISSSKEINITSNLRFQNSNTVLTTVSTKHDISTNQRKIENLASFDDTSNAFNQIRFYISLNIPVTDTTIDVTIKNAELKNILNY